MASDLTCSHCGTEISDHDIRGSQKSPKCPSCGNVIILSAVTPAKKKSKLDEEYIDCLRCGELNPENNYRCTECGAKLHVSSKPQYQSSGDSTLGGLIPYKNALALWSYYLSIFSLIPCVGIPLGFAALICGIKGLKYAKLNPKSMGQVHSWIGIVLGTICAVGYSLLIAIPLIMALYQRIQEGK